MKKLIICALCAICGFTTANAQGKFGHVNTQEVMQAMPEFTKAQNEIKALQDQYEADLKSMQDELQKKGEAFDKEQATLPENIKHRTNRTTRAPSSTSTRIIAGSANSAPTITISISIGRIRGATATIRWAAKVRTT